MDQNQRRRETPDSIGGEHDPPQPRDLREIGPFGARNSGRIGVIVFSVKSCIRPRITIRKPTV